MHPRTRRQKDVLDFITRYIKRHGCEPSYQQIAWNLGVASKSGIVRHMKALESQGLIKRRRENGSFGLEISSESMPAGDLHRIDWFEDPGSNEELEVWERAPLQVPAFMIATRPAEDIFAYRVNDDSMADLQICSGDIVLAERRDYAREGDIVVAQIGRQRAVLHQYFRQGAKTELRPSSSSFAPIVLPADRISIKGIMRALFRPCREG
jgi:repressor LexA